VDGDRAVTHPPLVRRTGFNTATWLLWVLAAVLPALLTRNPLYLVIVLLVCVVVRASATGAETSAVGFRLSVKLGLAVMTLTTLFNGLTLHYGETPLVTLPGRIPVFGGPITLEAMVFGAISGLAIVTLFAVFAVFNTFVNHSELLKMTPAFLFQAGLAASIAITFVPQTLTSLREIREAQMIRGHRFRGLRDLLPLFVPLVASGLERSIQLAEAMESRGFGRTLQDDGENPRRSALYRLSLAGALLTLLTGLFIRYFGPTTWDRLPGGAGSLLILLSTLAIVTLLWRASRRVKRSRYRKERWRGHDVVVTAASLIVVGLFLWLNFTHSEVLLYHPYPKVTMPSFDPLIGLGLLLLGLPAVAVNSEQ